MPTRTTRSRRRRSDHPNKFDPPSKKTKHEVDLRWTIEPRYVENAKAIYRELLAFTEKSAAQQIAEFASSATVKCNCCRATFLLEEDEEMMQEGRDETLYVPDPQNPDEDIVLYYLRKNGDLVDTEDSGNSVEIICRECANNNYCEDCDFQAFSSDEVYHCHMCSEVICDLCGSTTTIYEQKDDGRILGSDSYQICGGCYGLHGDKVYEVDGI